MHKHTNNVISALGNAPGFETIKAEDCKITRLGGMTNLVHLVETKDANIVVRIPGEGTEDYINRATELTNACLRLLLRKLLLTRLKKHGGY